MHWSGVLVWFDGMLLLGCGVIDFRQQGFNFFRRCGRIICNRHLFRFKIHINILDALQVTQFCGDRMNAVLARDIGYRVLNGGHQIPPEMID